MKHLTKFLIISFLALFAFAASAVATGDLNNDSKVDIIDLGILLSNWNSTSKSFSDINQDSRVDVIDLGIMLSKWGSVGEAKEDAYKRLTLIKEYNGNKLWWAERKNLDGTIDSDNAHYFLQLQGSYYDRGYAYGYLMADQIIESVTDMYRISEKYGSWGSSPTDKDIEIFTEVVLPNLPQKYKEELNGYIGGIVARRGVLTKYEKDRLLFAATGIQPLGVQTAEMRYPYLNVDNSSGSIPKASTGITVLGEHTKNSRENGDVVTIGSPGAPGGSEKVEKNRVVINFKKYYPNEADYVTSAFAGTFGFYSVGFNEDGVTLTGSAINFPFNLDTSIPINPSSVKGGWMPLGLLVREIISTPDNEQWLDKVESLIKIHQSHLVAFLLSRSNEAQDPSRVPIVYDLSTNKIEGYPQSTKSELGFDVLGQNDRNVDYRGKYMLSDGEIYELGENQTLLDVRNSSKILGSYTIELTDGEGTPIYGEITINGKKGKWYKRYIGGYNGGIITTNQGNTHGYFISDDGSSWGSWSADGLSIEFYDSNDNLLGSGKLDKNFKIGIKGSINIGGTDYWFEALSRIWDENMLDSDNAVHNLNLVNFAQYKKWGMGNAGPDFRIGRYVYYVNELYNRNDINAETMFDIVREMCRWISGVDCNTGVDYLLPNEDPLGGRSLGVVSTSAKHKELYVQFGKVYDDGYAPAINIRRKPIRYTADDLFNW